MKFRLGRIIKMTLYLYSAMHHNALQCTAQYYTIKQHGTTLHNCNLCLIFDKVKNILKISVENPL